MADAPKNRAWAPWAGAAAAGLCWGIAFPKWDISAAAWIAPALLLLATLPFAQPPPAPQTPRWKRPFRLGRFQLGYTAGLAHYLISLHWLLFIPHLPGALGGWIALSLYLALYPALWVMACGALAKALLRWNPAPQNSSPWAAFLRALADSPVSRRMLWAFLCAAAWVAWEMLISRMFTGFPWNLLGASQYKNIPLIQISAYTGIYGVSFLAVWLSLSLLTGLSALWLRANDLASRRAPFLPQIRFGEVVLPLAVLLLAVLFGFRRSVTPAPEGELMAIALVQPSIPQTLIWDRSQNAPRFEQLMKLSREALATRPDLLVWPEAAVPELLRLDPATAEAVQQLVREHRVHMILGADDATPKVEAPRSFRDYNFYNSSFALNPSGEIAGMYRKRRLVMFGEYVPFLDHFPFLKYLTPIGDAVFTPGKEVVPFDLPGLDARISVLICFEDVFPHLAREYVDEQTDFLLNLTNNGWFGESAAQWQHAASAVFRAVENGLPLVRCSNNGLSCWVDSRGRMFSVFYPGTDDIYGPGFKLAAVPRLPDGARRELTFYTRRGDLFGWACLLTASGALAAASWRRRP